MNAIRGLSILSTDALAGLRELFSEHPEILEPSTASVVQGCSRLVGDEVFVSKFFGYYH
jgi:hypothetical protein